MKISTTVIIPTFNGASKIGVLMNALEMQTVVPEEVIVVVDGSTDGTLEMLKKFEDKLPSLKIIPQHNKGRSAARNAAVSLSTHNLLIFFDDDMEPSPKCIEQHKAFHESKQFECLVSGNIKELVLPGRADIQNYKARLGQKWVEEFQPGLTRLGIDNLFFSSANCSVQKEVFERLNMFDERLQDAEDHDLAYRALETGISVFFDKNNVAIHHERITCRSYIIRLRSYREAHLKLRTLYPERTDTRLGNSPGFFKRQGYRIFARPIFVKWIDQGKLKFLPEKIRYEIYTFVIHSLANVFTEASI